MKGAIMLFILVTDLARYFFTEAKLSDHSSTFFHANCTGII